MYFNDDLLARLKSPDDAIGVPAWKEAEGLGAAAIEPLAELLAAGELEVPRRAKHALYHIVRRASAPGARSEAKAVERALVPLLRHRAPAARREAAWMLSEMGSEHAVSPIAALLTDEEVREDARCALMRFPGKAATAALRSAFNGAPEEFRYALADSLRKRGATVEGYPSKNRTPSRQTTVRAVPAKAK